MAELLSEPRVEATTYRVSLIPAELPEADVWDITISWRSPGLYAVTRSRQCCNRRGVWYAEPSPSNRTDRFVRSTRFPLDEAIAIAKKVAPKVIVNGLTPAGYVAWWNGRAAALPSKQEGQP